VEIVGGLICTVGGAYFFWQEVILRNITTSIGWFPGIVWESIAVIGGLFLTLSGILNLIDAMRWRTRGVNRRRILLIAFVFVFLGGSLLPVFSRTLEIPYQEEVAYTVEVPYNVTIETTVEVEEEIVVPYTVQVPVVITESVPVEIEEEVLIEEVIFERGSGFFSLGNEKSVDMYTFFVTEERSYQIEWSSVDPALAFAIAEVDTAEWIFDRLPYGDFTVVLTSTNSDGTYWKGMDVSNPASTASTLRHLETYCEVADFSTLGGSAQVQLEVSMYAFMLVTNVPVFFNIKGFYEYTTLETRTVYEDQSVTIYEEQIEYRNETITRDEIQYETITEYKEETRYRMEDRIRIIEEKFSLASELIEVVGNFLEL
jgi:hypothetical protein